MPIGGHQRQISPEEAKRRAEQLKKGAIEGDKIRQQSEEHKKKVDLPAAEEILEELDEIT